jgi:hypothetical protein
MLKLFAQHANVGDLHFETSYVVDAWEWLVLHNERTLHAGQASSLGDAILAAEHAAAVTAEWFNVGPEVQERVKPPFERRGTWRR